MNIYFLVEGRRTERKVYPRWLSVLLPQLAEIRFPHDDPEQMGNHDDFETHAQFHQDYLIELLKERNIRYSKKNPQGVIEEYYLNELIKRSKETLHIPTFQDFIDFCSMVRKELKHE